MPLGNMRQIHLSHYNCTLVNRNTCNNRHKFYDLVKTFMNSQFNFDISAIIKLESIKSELCHNLPVLNLIFTACVACENQFWNWFLQAKNPVCWNCFLQPDFSKIKYRSTGGLATYWSAMQCCPCLELTKLNGDC